MVRDQLVTMNPPRSEHLRTSQEGQHVEFSPGEVSVQIKGMSRDSSSGPSGFTVGLLKKTGALDRGLAALTRLVNIMGNGNIGTELTASRIIPLIKERNKVRPVAVGEVLLRLTARCLINRHRKLFSSYFAPLQFGVKQSQGTEKVVHRVRRDLRQGHAVLNADLSNAFNTISRERIRQQLEEKFPALLPYFLGAYTEGAPLYYQGELLTHSTEGVRQGDPLGPVLFSIGLHPVLEQIRSEFEGIGIYAYLDDVTFTGNLDDLAQVFIRFQELCEDSGLRLNMEKSNIIPADTQSTVEDLPHNLSRVTLSSQGAVLLGAPIGTTDFEDSFCLQKVRSLRKLLLVETEEAIPSQYRYLLLKDAVIPTLNYLLRTVPPENRISATTSFDNSIKRIVRNLLGGPEWGNTRWIECCRQIYLPLRYGGMGVPLAGHISEAAYTASIWEAGVTVDNAGDLVNELKRSKVQIEEEWLDNPPPTRKQQANLAGQIHQATFYHILDRADVAEKARLQAARQAGSQDWLTALPTRACQRFTDLQWRILARLRLGLPVSNREVPEVCPLCQTFVEDLGQHALECGHVEMTNHRTNRHHKLRDTLIGSFIAWGMITDKEPVISQGSQKRGDVEIYLPQGSVILDVSVTAVSPFKGRQRNHPSEATSIREEEKIRKYRESCTQQNKDFRPFTFQNLGGIGGKGLDFLNELKSRPPYLQVVNSKRYVDSLRKKLGCILMHSNAQMLLRWLHLVLPPSGGGIRTL
jgi:hypothetical protein